MSVSSILAFVLAGVAAKVKSVQVARRSEDHELVEAKRRIAELEDDIALANAQGRRDQELIDIWRERALGNVPRPGFGPPVPQIALQQAAAQMQAQAQVMQSQAMQSQLAQYNQQAALNAQNYGAQFQNRMLGQAAGLLGAQMIDAELWCNCVPARHDMFLKGE